MIFIGIDPGLIGAVAMIDDSPIVHIWDTPTITVQGAKKKKRHYLMQEMLKIFTDLKLKPGECTAVIEQVNAMPGQGVTSMFSMGFGLGAWHMLLAALNIPFVQVRPQEWKKAYGLHGKDKNGSIVRAKQLFPTSDIHLVKHDGRAEALLLAEYLRRRS